MMGRRDRKNEREEDRGVARDIALIAAGIGIGSAIALLLAPTSGEDARHALGKRYHRTMRRLGRSTEDLRERIEDLLEQANRQRPSRVLGLLKHRERERARAA